MLDLTKLSGQKKAFSLVLCVGGVVAFILGNAGASGIMIAAGAVVYAQSIEDKLEEAGLITFSAPRLGGSAKNEKTEEMP